VNQPTSAITAPQPRAKASALCQRRCSTVITNDTAATATKAAAAWRTAETTWEELLSARVSNSSPAIAQVAAMIHGRSGQAASLWSNRSLILLPLLPSD